MEMDKMTEYNKSMAERMNWGSPFEYHPERGEVVPLIRMARPLG
jgi:hypothetical protein